MVLGSPSAWDELLLLLTQPDNIPIVLMVLSVVLFTWLSLRESEKRDTSATRTALPGAALPGTSKAAKGPREEARPD